MAEDNEATLRLILGELKKISGQLEHLPGESSLEALRKVIRDTVGETNNTLDKILEKLGPP